MIAIAWMVAVVANVLVWAHHLYLDYPSGTTQAQINTAMQPITYALVLPSALSLYSLGFTIYRSRFRWTPASTALFFGLVGWLLAGLSGIVNATIAFDVQIHNTLWIVGHFHHMAMLNIGLLIFGATYALLPELTGKALYSEKLAWVHVWVTFVCGMIVFGIWLVQGLDGAPRRWAVLPSQFDAGTRISLAFVFVLAAAQALFFWNVLQTPPRQGRRRHVRRARDPGAVAVVEGVVGARRRGGARLVVLLLMGAFAVGGYLVGREHPKGGGGDDDEQATTGGGRRGQRRRRARPCSSAQVAGAATRSRRRTRPERSAPRSTRRSRPSALVVDRESRTGMGAMPPFEGQLSAQQIADVAAYVHAATSK